MESDAADQAMTKGKAVFSQWVEAVKSIDSDDVKERFQETVAKGKDFVQNFDMKETVAKGKDIVDGVMKDPSGSIESWLEKAVGRVAKFLKMPDPKTGK